MLLSRVLLGVSGVAGWGGRWLGMGVPVRVLTCIRYHYSGRGGGRGAFWGPAAGGVLILIQGRAKPYREGGCGGLVAGALAATSWWVGV